jgi:parvulin-like peptidyl-prolyl isomerase
VNAPNDDRAARRLLVAGAIAGIALAAFGVVRSSGDDAAAPADAIALVNGQALSREAYARFAAAIAAERRSTTLDASEQRRLLDRMIDEELLLQRGIALGLGRYEPTARGAIVSALVASVTADAETVEPDDRALRAFYAANTKRFGSGPRLAVEVAFVAAAGRPEALARERAETLARRLRAGEEFAGVRGELGDPMLAELPPGALDLDTLRDYLGPTAARAADELAVGEVAGPLRGSAGYFVVVLRERKADEPAPFESVRAQVRAEFLRSRGETALRDYLAGMREEASIQILDPELAAP